MLSQHMKYQQWRNNGKELSQTSVIWLVFAHTKNTNSVYKSMFLYTEYENETGVISRVGTFICHANSLRENRNDTIYYAAVLV